MQYVKDHMKVILFDHDDTLVGTIDAKWAEHKYIAKKYFDKTLTEEELKKHWGKPLSTLVGLLYGTKDIDMALKVNLANHEKFPKILKNDTIRTLKHFHKAGKKLGVITATHRWSLDYDLDTLGIPRDLFDYFQTEDKTKYHKPDPRVFDPVHKWIKKLNIKPKEVVYVGDGLHDMQAALGAGFEFIGIATGLITQKEFRDNGAVVVNKLEDLIKV